MTPRENLILVLSMTWVASCAWFVVLLLTLREVLFIVLLVPMTGMAALWWGECIQAIKELWRRVQ